MNRRKKWFLAKISGKLLLKIKIIEPNSNSKLYAKIFTLPDDYTKVIEILEAYR